MSNNSLEPWPLYSEAEIASIGVVLSSGNVNYWTGEQGRLFEQEYAALTKTKCAVALTNGTAALELSLEASGIGSGDDVIVTPRTFLASASCVVRTGARPVFADVSPDSQNITPESVRDALTPTTRAIIPVHHAGWPCEMDGIMAIAKEYDLVIIEDCAQAHGATYKHRPVGSMGHFGAFSFCQDKIITTGGEGGMVVTNDEVLWKKAWAIKDHGKSYDVVYSGQHPPGFRWLSETFGTNLRMTEMQAAIGRIQLTKLERWNEKRTSNANSIRRTLEKYPCVRVPVPDEHVRHAYYRLYAFVVPEELSHGWDRDRILNQVNELGIPCFTGSCPEVYNEKAFADSGFRPEKPLPVAHSLGPLSLAFLVHPTLTSNDIERTCSALDAVLEQATR